MNYFIKVFIFLTLNSSYIIGADLDLDKKVLDANRTNKHIMLFLHKDGCGFCEKMLFDLEDENLSNRIDKDFILVDINRDDDETISFDGFKGTNREFLKKLGVDLYPTVAFLDNNSSFIYNTVGYRNPKKFTTILNYISSKAYKKITFEEFEDESLTNSKSK
jgi:thioredoxin-related protein